jgi:hypothetical protein
MGLAKMIDIYLVPHHDDEIFLLDHLGKCDTSTSKAIFIFLTYDDETSVQVAESRRVASEKVLKRICHTDFSVLNLGKELGVSHRKLVFFEQEVISILENYIVGVAREYGPDIKLYAPLFENGHMDHIEAFWILYKIKLNVNKNFYSTYSFDSFNFPKVQIENESRFQNGVQKRIGRLLPIILSVCTYKTEFKTWIILGPILLLKSLKFRFSHSIFNEVEMIEILRDSEGVISNPARKTLKSWQINQTSYLDQLNKILSDKK